jgi:hypothetical protein
MKKQTQILKTLHTFLKADDIENFMVALKAVMANTLSFGNKNLKLKTTGGKYGFDHETVADYFEYEVDSPAMDKDFWRFQDLCESCMDFAMVGIVKHQELIF